MPLPQAFLTFSGAVERDPAIDPWFDAQPGQTRRAWCRGPASTGAT
jgi:hypothetical protein